MAWIGLIACAGAAPAQLVIPPPTPPPVPLAEETLALGDAASRMTVPVSIGRRGPWPFIIDTGSERTVVAQELAGVLGLPAGPTRGVLAMTGRSEVPTVIVPALRVSSVAAATIEAPALQLRHMGAPGLLGIDALQGHSIAIDFDARRMTLTPVRRRSRHVTSAPDLIVVTAKSLYGQLIVTDARWRSTRIAVVIDTGSAISVGNPALLAAMASRPPRPLGRIGVTSATGGVLVADAYAVDGLAIAGIGFADVPIAIADAAPFRRFGLARTPALLLGMDALRLFRRVQIDFANREIRFTLPRRGVPVEQGFATRLPG